MGTAERREREKQELRTRILDAARELFAEEGYDAVTMRRIAERIEYSPTAIYFHFRDKHALMQELCDEDFGALAGEFQKIAAITDPIDRLRRIGQAYVGFAMSHRNHYRLMFMTPHPEAMRPEDSRLTRGNPEEDAYAFLKATVAEAIAAGRLRPELDGRGPRLPDRLGRHARRRLAPHRQVQGRLGRLARPRRDRARPDRGPHPGPEPRRKLTWSTSRRRASSTTSCGS